MGWKHIWSTPTPPKVLNFAWRLATDSLATCKNKQKRNLQISAMCPICNCEEEDSFHTFCSCINARRLWREMSVVWDLPDVTKIMPTGREWFVQIVSDLNEHVRLRLMMLLWRIWYVRNELVHHKPAPPVDVSCRFLASCVASLHSIALNPQADHSKGKYPAMVCFPLAAPTCNIKRLDPSPWAPPVAGRVKLNTDGSVLNGVAGTGMILRDHVGNIIFSSCRYLFSCNDMLETEIMGIREGLSLALQWSNLPIDVESDNLEAVKMILTGDMNRSKYAFLIEEIKASLIERNSCITHVVRSKNNT